jgi:hypothetical protein
MLRDNAARIAAALGPVAEPAGGRATGPGVPR